MESRPLQIFNVKKKYLLNLFVIIPSVILTKQHPIFLVELFNIYITPELLKLGSIILVVPPLDNRNTIAHVVPSSRPH